MTLKNKRIISIVLILFGLIYPFLVYFGIELLSFRIISLLVGIALVGGFFLQDTRPRKMSFFVPMLVAIFLCMAGAFSNHPSFMLYLPVLFSMSLFFSFGYTLLYPPSIIEVFARMVIAERSREEIEYCRRVTFMWVLFFILNGAMAFFTACCTSLATWSLYNGLISYFAIGMLFAAELCCRYWRFRRYAGLRTDFIFKKLFPPKE